MVPFTFPIGVRHDWTLENESELNQRKGQARKSDSKWEGLSGSTGKDGMCKCGKAGERCEVVFQRSCLAHSSLLRYSSNPTFIQQVDERGPASTSQIQFWNQKLSLHSVNITNWTQCIWKWSVLTSASRCQQRSLLETNPSLLIFTSVVR